MNAIVLLLFLGGGVVAGMLILFGWSLMQGTFDAVDQTSLLPLEADNGGPND